MRALHELGRVGLPAPENARFYTGFSFTTGHAATPSSVQLTG